MELKTPHSTTRTDKLAAILDTKVVEGLAKLEQEDVSKESFTICLNNLLTSMELLNKIIYVPKKQEKK